MNCQLLCCDNIVFNSQFGYHELGKVINKLELSTRPKVFEYFVLVKLLDVNPKESYEVELLLKAGDGSILSYTEKFVLYNKRSKEQVPGVDASMKMKAVITKIGNYMIELHINGVLTVSYPIYITDKGESA